jgi:hypothetical protein
MNKENLSEIIQALILNGEDREELSYWLEIYPFLAKEKQDWLRKHLFDELSKLEGLKRK